MSRKLELIKMENLFRSQAKSVRSRFAKQALQKLADYYQHEAELLDHTSKNQSAQSRPKSAA